MSNIIDLSRDAAAAVPTPSLPLENIKHPGINDVMFGRGGETNYHIGNHRFRVLADEHRAKYRGSTRKEKAVVVQEVVRIWRARQGRFLAKTNPEKGDESKWHDVGDEVARKKAAKILSEKASSRQRGKTTEASTSAAGTDASANLKRPAAGPTGEERPAKAMAVAPTAAAMAAATPQAAAAANPQAAAAAAWARQAEMMRSMAQLPPALHLPTQAQAPLPAAAAMMPPTNPAAAAMPPIPGGMAATAAAANNLRGGPLNSLDLLRLRNNSLAASLAGVGPGALATPPHSQSSLALLADALVQEEQLAATATRAHLANSILMRNLGILPTGNRFAANAPARHLGLSADQLRQLVRDSQPAGSGRDPEESKPGTASTKGDDDGAKNGEGKKAGEKLEG